MRSVVRLNEILLPHDRRSPATLDGTRGWLWMSLVAAVFVWLSNPLVFIPGFGESLQQALIATGIVAVITLPWLCLPRAPWPWLLFLVWCAFSAIWSIAPDATLQSTLLYAEMTALALVLAANCEAEVLGWGLAVGGALVVGLSAYAYVRRLPGAYYPYIDRPLFTGIGTNQNILAYTLAVAMAGVLAVGPPQRLAGRLAWAAVLITNLVGVYLAGSATGYVAVLAVFGAALLVAVWPRLSGLHRHSAWLVAGGAVVASGVALLTVVGVLDKQVATVSGRSPFWAATLETSREAPVLGRGWGAVWEHPWNAAPLNPVVQEIYDRAGYGLTHGHNFFIDLVPELGLVGVGLSVLMVVHAVVRARILGISHASADSTGGGLIILILVALLVFGVTEPMLTIPLGWWVLAMVVCITLPSRPQGGEVLAASRARVAHRGRHRATTPRHDVRSVEVTEGD